MNTYLFIVDPHRGRLGSTHSIQCVLPLGSVEFPHRLDQVVFIINELHGALASDVFQKAHIAYLLPVGD
jgi:hypothetical protein